MNADAAQGKLPKHVVWVGSSRRDIKRFPRDVRSVFGQALFDAQMGSKHPSAKPLQGFGGAGVLEVVEDELESTYRAIYTINFPGAVYVLHAFQKKSKSGIKTPPREREKIRSRLQDAESDYAEGKKRQKDRENHAPPP